MTITAYEIVQHDGGWAYRVAGSHSETFATHEAANDAAMRAAAAQGRRGEDTEITYQDSAGDWHQEIANGSDRPDPMVIDQPDPDPKTGK